MAGNCNYKNNTLVANKLIILFIYLFIYSFLRCTKIFINNKCSIKIIFESSEWKMN